MKLNATRYFQNAGYVDAIRGNTMAHIATLPEYARVAYARGQALAQPKVYTYKLNRSVGEYKSGTLFQRFAKIPNGAKGTIAVETVEKPEGQVSGVTVDMPVSRLILV